MILDEMDCFLRPLFSQPLDKTYNLNKCIELQRPLSKKVKEEEFFTTVEEESLEDFINQKKQEKLDLYRDSLKVLMTYASQPSGVMLADLNQNLSEEEKASLIPSVEIFKELIIELLQAKEIDLDSWRQERAQNFSENSLDFQLSTCLLDVIELYFPHKQLREIRVYRLEEDSVVTFKNIIDESGRKKTIKCSNVYIEAR